MKVNVKVKAGEFRFATLVQVEDYISKHKKYNVKCKILDRESRIFSNIYNLLLEGTKEDIESFLGFLRMKGFSIKKY